MRTYILAIPADEIVRLLRREIAAAGGQPELYHCAWEDYIIEEVFDRAAYGIHDGDELNLVSIAAILNIEPRLEQNYWVLKVVVQRKLGPQTLEDENALIGAELTLNEFDERFLAPGGDVTVRLEAETPAAKAHFDQWLAELQKRHPAGGDS